MPQLTKKSLLITLSGLIAVGGAAAVVGRQHAISRLVAAQGRVAVRPVALPSRVVLTHAVHISSATTHTTLPKGVSLPSATTSPTSSARVLRRTRTPNLHVIGDRRAVASAARRFAQAPCLSPCVRPRQAAWPTPAAPRDIVQIGGLEPVSRVLAAGAWDNASTLTVVVEMRSRARHTTLQPQIELRPLGVPLIGRPTTNGAAVVVRSPGLARGVVHLTGLRDGLAYRWRVRVRDGHGAVSRWTTLNGSATAPLIRIHLAVPSAPLVRLVTTAGPAGWVARRTVTLQWTPPGDVTGIRGYAYTLARSPLATPALHLRTTSARITVTATGDGRWYFTVRALNRAHSWSHPARMMVQIDSVQPQLTALRFPGGPVNPRRIAALVSAHLRRWASVAIEVTTPAGRRVYRAATGVQRPGATLQMVWNGEDAAGVLVPNGHYIVRVTATSRSGLRWSTARSVDIETHAPLLTAFGPQSDTYNPYNDFIYGREAITVTLSAPAHVQIDALLGSRLMRRWSLDAPQAERVVTATWDGTGRGDGRTMLPSGQYQFRLTAVDAAGNSTTSDLGAVTLDLRRIVVSLKDQRLWALDGHTVLLTSLVTTGGPELPTPTGDFQIIDRESPFTFHSPFPVGSPYWYADSPTSFALLFQINGYFIHDAPWRSFFGPGSNVVNGKPGQNTTGTHGCVNMPYTEMNWLFKWATMYTPVQVRANWTPS